MEIMEMKEDREDLEGLRKRALAIFERLVTEYGRPVWRSHGDPLEVLVGAFLSQNTSDVKSSRAFQRLRERFPSWEVVMTAPVEEIEEAIRPGGLARSKAPRIQAALRRIMEERGELSLDFLSDMPLPAARAWLQSLHGVGAKTAAIVLLFSLGRPLFPVDTHVHRVSRRLGIAPENASPEQTEARWESLMPPDTYYPLHIDLIRHGRRVCKARDPLCHVCVLKDLCDYYRREVLVVS
ncbi:MAG TPA: endonuclease III [Caldilineae bacterium]|nr:endonuclease III [Caldilineae bacterium]